MKTAVLGNKGYLEQDILELVSWFKTLIGNHGRLRS